ncbi:MAG: Hsp20 family protein [Chitinivibrionales bacterium]|nr:Hsp20 family protein [Chitinivibrionales bacterium]MBD3357890.1 Hsp20 family protein [Chitinivibrionales bacterium]
MMMPTDMLRDLERMRRQMDEMYGRRQVFSTYRYPPVNVYDNDDRITLVAELPGVSKEDVSIDLRNSTFTISGTRTVAGHEKGYEVLRCELPEGGFEKSIRLTTKVDESKIVAALEDGILRVVLPKAEEAKPRRISIQ